MMRRALIFVVSAVMLGAWVTPASAADQGEQVQQVIRSQTGSGAVRSAEREAVGNVAIHAGRSAGTTLASYVQKEAGSLRLLATIEDPTQSTVDFKLDLPAGVTVIVESDRSVSMGVLGTIKAPWAVDANGKKLSTSYTYAGGVLTQHVDTTGADFPVVADPMYIPSLSVGWYNWGVVEYAQWSRVETFGLYNNFYLQPIATGLGCSFFPWPANVGCAAIGGYYSHQLYVQLQYAVSHYHRCLKVRIPMPVPYFTSPPAIYTVYC